MKVVMLQSVERLPVASLKKIKMCGVEYEIIYVVRKIRLTLSTVSMQPYSRCREMDNLKLNA